MVPFALVFIFVHNKCINHALALGEGVELLSIERLCVSICKHHGERLCVIFKLRVNVAHKHDINEADAFARPHAYCVRFTQRFAVLKHECLGLALARKVALPERICSGTHACWAPRGSFDGA